MNEPTKTCRRCGAVLPATSEYFSVVKSNNNRLHSYCKSCTRSISHSWVSANRDKKSEYNKRYVEKHKEELAPKNAAYREANRDVKAAYARQYRIDHPDKYRAALKRWRKNHLEYSRAKKAKRRALKLEAGGEFTAKDVNSQYERQKGKCFYCEKKVGDSFHVDHVTPLALGGSNGPENIVIACPDCNMRKHAKHPMEFAGILL